MQEQDEEGPCAHMLPSGPFPARSAGDVTALEGLHVTEKYRTNHDAHMLQACGLGSPQVMPDSMCGVWGGGRVQGV